MSRSFSIWLERRVATPHDAMIFASNHNSSGLIPVAQLSPQRKSHPFTQDNCAATAVANTRNRRL